MTLGRTTSGAIKIKTDGGLRAVNCACCVTCPCPLPDEIKGKKIAVTGVSWSTIVSYSIMDACGTFSAQTADGYTIYFEYQCPPSFSKWIGSIYNGGPIGDDYSCNLFSTFIDTDNPIGTHDVVGDYAPSEDCNDWTLTISEVP